MHPATGRVGGGREGSRSGERAALARAPPPFPPRLGRANGLLYATHTRYEGRVRRYGRTRGFGFLTATHQLTPMAAGEDARGAALLDGAAEGGGVVAIDGVRHRRRPVRIGDIFVHYQKLRTPLGAARAEAFWREFTVGARVLFRADWVGGSGSLQAVDVQLWPPPGWALAGGRRGSAPAREASPIGPDPRLCLPCKFQTRPSTLSNGLTSSFGDSDAGEHPAADAALPRTSEQADEEGALLIISADLWSPDHANLPSPEKCTFVWNLRE